MDRFFLRSGAYRAPSTVFRTPGAAPTILKLLWLGESDKALYSDCLVRCAEHLLRGPNTGIKSARVYPEHPRTSYVGAEADNWPTLNLYIQTAAQEGKLLYNTRYINDLV